MAGLAELVDAQDCGSCVHHGRVGSYPTPRPIKENQMTLYRYTGDIKKLKPNGWTFQKLYARNYKSYRKNGIWMFVISKMRLEIDNIKTKDQATDVRFILENMNRPDSFWQAPSPFFTETLFPTWAIQSGEIMTRKQANKNKRDWFLKFEKDNTIPYLEDGEPIRFKWIQTIKELVELGGVNPI